ncbi:hypothetical protein RG47T_3191 [Mucilaginibacter polytrichastri]|uniref:Uncharacterized protein n=1 Tax=Mucilaginibacter polytrichastri TaxID=1302689 RepID=A0A1Q6A133_9SPHI|nr:hypothetical protein RG47T_3191 [Mucilaginibacter polytrichastri]
MYKTKITGMLNIRKDHLTPLFFAKTYRFLRQLVQKYLLIGNQNNSNLTKGPRGTLKCNICLHFLQLWYVCFC